MSENVENTGIDVLVELELSNVKSKLRRKIVKNIKKGKLGITINVDIYGVEEGSIDILADAVATITSIKRKKNKK